MHGLKLNVQTNHPISRVIDDIARYTIASLSYFELESIPERHENVLVGTGHILCFLRESDPEFKAFINQLSRSSAYFYLNSFPISGRFGDHSCLGADVNIRKRVQLNIGDSFTISLKQEGLETCNINSPYSVAKLVVVQGLNVYFGRADHQKRKRCADTGLPAPKRQRRIRSSMNRIALRKDKSKEAANDRF